MVNRILSMVNWLIFTEAHMLLSLRGAIEDSSLRSEQALQSQNLRLLRDFIPRNDTVFTEHLHELYLGFAFLTIHELGAG